jgi:OOP family OmpA-OmpF porin
MDQGAIHSAAISFIADLNINQQQESTMRSKNFVFSFMGVALIAAGAMSAHAQEGYYDPSNAASPTGKTIGYELYKTIGCPGQQIFGTPCKDLAPKDSDGDGVTDDKDKCPNTPKGRKVNADGCELDSDGDGLVDGVDKCPTVYAKTADGCPPSPPAAAAPKKLVLEGVNFDNDKATLRPEASATLDRMAAELKEWGDVKVEVAGHTDARASARYNQQLSERRANTVRDYLIGKGIAADRLSAKGYGESQPVADNDTEEGRAKNRRVELIEQQ